MSKNPVHSFKVLIVGDGGVGKTSFINRVSSCNFNKSYDVSDNIHVTPLFFNTQKGYIQLDCWVCPGQYITQKFDHASDIDALILMFDVTSSSSYLNIPYWHNKLRSIYKPGTPVILCGNKVDVKDRIVKPNCIYYHFDNNELTNKLNNEFGSEFSSEFGNSTPRDIDRKLKSMRNTTTDKIVYYDISARSNYNIEKPFLYIIRKLLNDNSIQFINTPSLLDLPKVSTTTTNIA